MEPTTKAVVIKKFGGYDVISIEPINLPALNDKIEIKTNYAGVNFADLYTRQGLIPNLTFPLTLGIESTGIITAIGDEVETDLKIGQRVICYNYTGGLYSETVRISKNLVYPLPDGVGLEIGAAIFVNYLTSYISLFELGNLKENQNVLILSCAGGIGCASTQLARTINGVKIYGICSPGKEEECQRNGVDHAIVYNEFKDNISNLCPNGFDLIISNQSGKFFQYLQTLLKPLGSIVCIGANNLIENERKLSTFNLLKAWWTNKSIPLEHLICNNQAVAGLHLGILSEKYPEKTREILNRIFTLIKDKKISPKIHAVEKVDNIIGAMKILGERKNIGKVLISFPE